MLYNVQQITNASVHSNGRIVNIMSFASMPITYHRSSRCS